MKDVNTLVRLPQLTGTMRQLSQYLEPISPFYGYHNIDDERETGLELVKAGIIEEMVDGALPEDQLLEGEEEEADAEVDRVLEEVLHGKLAKVEGLRPAEKPLEEEPEEAFEDQEATLEQMRGRLEALKS
jgi:charged multivesicular body protein 3